MTPPLSLISPQGSAPLPHHPPSSRARRSNPTPSCNDRGANPDALQRRAQQQAAAAGWTARGRPVLMPGPPAHPSTPMQRQGRVSQRARHSLFNAGQLNTYRGVCAVHVHKWHCRPRMGRQPQQLGPKEACCWLREHARAWVLAHHAFVMQRSRMHCVMRYVSAMVRGRERGRAFGRTRQLHGMPAWGRMQGAEGK